MVETIAITVWNDIVSPLYDASCCIEIILSDGSLRNVDVRSMSLYDKADCCAKEGASVLICGAISTVGSALLFDKNIKVIPWIRGPIKEIISAYRNGEDVIRKYSMPGCGPGLCVKGRHRNRRGCCGMR